jgi:hypothetical protein
MDHDTYLRLLLLATPFIAKEDNTYKQQETGKIRPQGGKRIDFCSGFLYSPRPQRRRHTCWGIPQGLDCSGRTLRKSRSCMDTFKNHPKGTRHKD